MTYNKVATCGCEILNDDGVIVAWAVDQEWAENIVKALEKQEEEEECILEI